MIVAYTPDGPDLDAAGFTQDRLRDRLGLLVEQFEDHLGGSLPQACQGQAAYKGAGRFFAHPQTAVANLLPAFVRPAVRLACRCQEVVVPHDTSSFNYSSLREATGLGFLNDSPQARGLHLHSSLLLDESGVLFGIAHLHFWVRQDFRQASADQVRALPIEQKESYKWLLGLRATDRAFRAVTQNPPRLIHVMDREGDVHEVFAEVKRLRQDAVIRCAQNRRVAGGPPDAADYSQQHVARQAALGQVELRVPLREGGYRTAVCEVRAARVRLSPGAKRRRGRRPLSLGLIEVREISTPPAGEQAARWWLWTTLPVRRPGQIQRVLRIYRARWRLEEYHRTLKTSCRVERLRLSSGEKLMKAITLQAWVATRVVRLRDRVKDTPQGSCRECFGAAEWQTLWARAHQRPWRPEDGEPTLEEVVRWLGRLGGHLGRKCDGRPGAEVLSRGLCALALLLEGRELGRAEGGVPPGAATGERGGPAEPPTPP